MKRRYWITGAVLALGILAGVLLRGQALPLWVTWENRHLSSGQTEVIVQKRQVSVLRNGTALWQSDEGVKVQDALYEDIDRDGQRELMLLCWKRGRYGDSRPFWVTEDETVWSQHIFLYDVADTVKPIWMASDIGMEVRRWSFHERHRLLLTQRDGNITAWDWVTWGLSRVEPSELTFAAVGDSLIHRPIYDYALRHFGGSFDSLFDGVREELSRYDVTSINQETPYVREREEYSDYPCFGTPIEVGEAVVDAGFAVVSAATNHALDKGVEAIDRAVELYADAGVVCAGVQHSEDEAYRPYELLEKNGIRCAVFSYTQSTNGLPVPEDTPYVLHTLEEGRVRADLALGRGDADLCVVYVHWGTEYDTQPDDDQRYWAQVFADCGADVVIGTHPHVLQPVEWITGQGGNETLVYYSLGNFISAQTDPACTVGGLAYFTVTRDAGTCRVTDHGLKKLITEQNNGLYTVRLQEE